MKKLENLDIFKAIGALLVVLIHVTSEPVAAGISGFIGTALVSINKFSLPAVPMFIFASGLALTYSFMKKPLSWTDFIKRRFTKIVIPYLFWSCIYYVFFVKLGFYAWSPVEFIKLTVSGYLVFHLYFVVIIVQFYLLFNVIYELVNKIKAKWMIFSSLVIAVLFKLIVSSSWTDRIFITYLPFFVCGCYFAKHLSEVHKQLNNYATAIWAGFLVSGIVFAFGLQSINAFFMSVFSYSISSVLCRMTSNIFYIIFCLLGCLAAMIAADSIANTEGAIKKIFIQINRGSYYIYLAHPAVILYAGSVVYPKFGITGIIDRMIFNFAAIVAVVFPLSALYVYAKHKLKSRNG